MIGAGISGLVCAYRLMQAGIHSLVLESEERPGGLITSIRRDGFVFESGPQCPRFPAAVWRLVRQLNLESDFVAGDRKAKRYILHGARLHQAPFSPAGLITTRLVGFRSKMRILTEAFRRSHPPAHEESLADFIKRKFGAEVLENLVDPLISTIFFGDSNEMGMESAFPALVEWERSKGSLVRGAIHARKSKRGVGLNPSSAPAPAQTNGGTLNVSEALPSLGSFKSGMGALPERVSEELKERIKYRAKIESVAPVRGEDGIAEAGWRIHLSDGEEITAEFLVLAVPAYVAARFLQRSAPQLSLLLDAIEYEPICVVSLAYDRSKVSNRLNGFGFMAPRVEGLQTICTFWNSSLFESHAPRGMVLMTSFAGRGTACSLSSMPEEECAQTVETENAKILGVTGRPVDRVIWRHPRALPQYKVGHAQRVAEIQDLLRRLPNLYLAGNFLKGRSIDDCVEIASNVAEALHSRFHGQNIQPPANSLAQSGC